MLSVLASVSLGSLLLTLSLPAPSWATDRTIAPPTCPSIQYKCQPRAAQGALQNAEEQLLRARQKLKSSEEQAGTILTLGYSPPGEAELVEFWRDEFQRLTMNNKYLNDIRSRLSTSDGKSLRLVQRLEIFARDVDQEATFWCEAVGMQRYGELPGGGILVSFGPPGLATGDEGAFFAIGIRPALELESLPTTVRAGEPQLSFIQIATPSQLRPYKAEETGGQLLDSYGFYALKSPSGVVVRAYVGDRRDPVEFVALAADPGESLAIVGKKLESLGLTPGGSYNRVSPAMQEYMPRLPTPNKLYLSGDPVMSAQVLLLPAIREEPVMFSTLKRVPANDDGKSVSQAVSEFFSGVGNPTSVEADEPMERPYSPFSNVRNGRLIAFAPQAEAKAAAVTRATSNSAAVTLELRSVADAG